jgi:ubiquitin carboxyl-terminal hydrolase 7
MTFNVMRWSRYVRAYDE